MNLRPDGRYRLHGVFVKPGGDQGLFFVVDTMCDKAFNFRVKDGVALPAQCQQPRRLASFAAASVDLSGRAIADLLKGIGHLLSAEGVIEACRLSVEPLDPEARLNWHLAAVVREAERGERRRKGSKFVLASSREFYVILGIPPTQASGVAKQLERMADEDDTVPCRALGNPPTVMFRRNWLFEIRDQIKGQPAEA